jgi:chromosome segregation protein
MLLTKLEIKGFKSFADRVTIHFDEGITGIVGPNGCGKSNVVDAIRWVLGEQKTKALRSEKMDNVVFNGTKKRKPTQLAEASLTFKNTKNLLPTEYSTVTITRRYYRSGDSEYELNGVQCRLKDITGLFLDTGIASNSYAIIELKMVDDLLNDKDNSRRALFEEAAGISKFRVRKKETLRKLEGTDDDLDRVEDLLFEIEKNLKSLERQARQTKRYYELKEDYKRESVSLFRMKISNEGSSLGELDSKIKSEEAKKLELTAKLATGDQEIEKAKAELISKEKALSEEQKKLNSHVADLRQYENEKKIKNERLKFLRDRSDELNRTISVDKLSNERSAFSLDGLKKEKNSIEALAREQHEQLSRVKTELDSNKEKIDLRRSNLINLQEEQKNNRESLYSFTKDLEVKQIQVNSLKGELKQTASDSSEHTENIANFSQRLESLKTSIKEKSASFEKTKQKEAKNDQKILDLNQTIELIKDELTSKKRKLDAKKNEYGLTKSLVENLEGFPEAIKFLKKESGWSKDAPLLSDIITCDEDYRVTIENYLENYMNHYVVDDENQALKAVNLLSDASRGKANFFVLSSFENFEPKQVQLFEKCMPATEIVEFEPKYRKLISFILDKVFVIEGDFSDIPQQKDAVFITKSGMLTVRKHIISGGSVGLFEGKRIGRVKNLAKLDKEIKKLEDKIAEIEINLEKKQKEVSKQKALTLKVDLETTDMELRQLNDEFISLETKKEQFEKLITNSSTRREDLIENIEKLEQEIKELIPSEESLKKEVERLEEDIKHRRAELQVVNDNYSEVSKTYNEENIQYHKLENKIKSLEQEISYKKHAYEQSLERVESNIRELRKTDDEIKNLIEKTEKEDDELIKMYEQKETYETQVNQAEKNYYGHRGVIDSLEKQNRELQRSKEQIDLIIHELEDKASEKRLNLATIKERLSVEFNLDTSELEKTVEESEETGSEEELTERVNHLKNKLEKIGPINPMAMEAYEEIKQRHEFITSQRDDLLNAKNSLLQTISEIDQVAKETFMDAFAKIKVNFEKVFRTLFTEQDECDLKLSDPDNPLESAIEIMAKPKGKRPLTINQLSGGEKTLTATSLLFAIYLLKPAPFCIFDEVDAPLDDANIDKFNHIIREFSNDSQFIIVTHNKRTMTTTDIIYGITMVEQGVSKVVPVDLREVSKH